MSVTEIKKNTIDKKQPFSNNGNASGMQGKTQKKPFTIKPKTDVPPRPEGRAGTNKKENKILYKGPHRPTPNSRFFKSLKDNEEFHSPRPEGSKLAEPRSMDLSEKRVSATSNKSKNLIEKQKEIAHFSENIFPQDFFEKGGYGKNKKTQKFEADILAQLNQKESKLILLNKLINSLMMKGKQSTAQKIMNHCYFLIKTKEKESPLNFIVQSIQNVKPLIELEKKSKKNFSSKKASPIPIPPRRAVKLAIEWLIEGAKQRPERSLATSLYLEMSNAYQKKGYAIKKKEEMHNLCKSTFYKSDSLRSSKKK